MGSRRGTLGTQQQRREAAKAKLVEATIGLIGEHGPSGFSVSDIADRSGLDRGLVAHHFKTVGALILAAATASVLEGGDATLDEPGLGPMLGWVEAELARAFARDPSLLAKLQVVVGPAVEAFAELRAAYWQRQVERLHLHLSTDIAVHQVSADLVPFATATFVLGALHGEQLRIIATGQPSAPGFVDVLRRALSPAATPKPSRKTKPPKPGFLDLFDPSGR